jgi:hypothetical protein
MAAHKQHCSFGFWQRAALALDGKGEDADGMGQFGRITSIADLPDEKTLVGYVQKAVALKDAGAKLEKPAAAKPRAKTASLQVPPYLANAAEVECESAEDVGVIQPQPPQRIHRVAERGEA